MHQGSDYSSQYYPHHPPTPLPNPNPNEFVYASAPPFDFDSYPQNPDPNPYQPQFPHHPQQPCYDYPYAPSPNSNPNPSPYANPPIYSNDNPVAGYGSGHEAVSNGIEEGVYAYDGGIHEPYGARGTGGFNMSSSSSSSSNSSSGLKFDDYGRPLGAPVSSAKEQPKIVRASPKVESHQDVKNGVRKFQVKVLPEWPSSPVIDVLCQIGLDGIRMLDPSTNRTLRIYPLENVIRWEVRDSTTFAFWSKSPVDIEPRCVRIQSNGYTINTILDIVTAATVQLKELGGKDALVGSRGSADTSKPHEQTTDKKKGFVDWVNLIKPGNEETDHWVPDEAVSKCTSCATDFGAFVRKHHCRNCGDIFCDKCTQGRIALTADEQAQQVRVCDRCMAEVTERLSNAKEVTSKSTAIHSHEDLARKLQEEMEKNLKLSSGSKSDGSGKRTREVECPICTVHLQVQVPTSGSETIECGVCQHPFLVSAH